MSFEVGQCIRAQLPLRPDLHVDLIRHDDGWYEIEQTTWAPIESG